MDNVLNNRLKGDMGEEIACKYLINKGFKLRERNFWRKWGELDIIAEKDKKIHFFEVKSVTSKVFQERFDSHKAEDNVDDWKVKHLRRIIETYLSYSGEGMDAPFEFHVLSVYFDVNTRYANIKWLNNIIL